MKHIRSKKKLETIKKLQDVLVICKNNIYQFYQKNVELIFFRFNKFQQQQELWQEVERVTAALRTENEAAESDIHFLCEMFKHIPLGKQFQIIVIYE